MNQIQACAVSAKSSFLQLLRKGRKGKLNEFLTDRINDESMVAQLASDGHLELVTEDARGLNHRWYELTRAPTAKKQPDYFVKQVLCNQKLKGLVFRETTPKGEKTKRTFRVETATGTSCQLQTYSYNQEPAVASRQTYCYQETAVASNQTCSSQEAAGGSMEVRGYESSSLLRTLSTGEVNQRERMQPTMIMSTVQGPETVGRHESPSHQPDTLNAFDTSLCSAMNPASNHLPLQTLPATDDFKASSELQALSDQESEEIFASLGLPPTDDIEASSGFCISMVVYVFLHLSCVAALSAQENDEILASLGSLSPIDDTKDGNVPQYPMSLIRRPAISPPYSPCSGGQELVIYAVPLTDGENYSLYFMGQKGTPFVDADVAVCPTGDLVLHAISPRYESPERVEVYVVNSQNVIVNEQFPLEFEFMDDNQFGVLLCKQIVDESEASEPYTANMDELLSLNDGNVQSSATTTPSLLEGLIPCLPLLFPPCPPPSFVSCLLQAFLHVCIRQFELHMTGISAEDTSDICLNSTDHKEQEKKEDGDLLATSTELHTPLITAEKAYANLLSDGIGNRNVSVANGPATVELGGVELDSPVHLAADGALRALRALHDGAVRCALGVLRKYFLQGEENCGLAAEFHPVTAVSHHLAVVSGCETDPKDVHPFVFSASTVETCTLELSTQVDVNDADAPSGETFNQLYNLLCDDCVVWPPSAHLDAFLVASKKLSKSAQLRSQEIPLNSNLIDETGVFINRVGLTRKTLLQLAKRLGSDVEKRLKESGMIECNELDDTEVATCDQVEELLRVASTTGSCVEEIIGYFMGLQESSCRVDFLEIPDCNQDVLRGFEELIVGITACQLEDSLPLQLSLIMPQE